jgi:hypothetical protein
MWLALRAEDQPRSSQPNHGNQIANALFQWSSLLWGRGKLGKRTVLPGLQQSRCVAKDGANSDFDGE